MAQDENDIIADVNVNIDKDDVQNLADMAAYAEKARVNFEAMTRASSDVSSRLNDMANANKNADNFTSTPYQKMGSFEGSSNYVHFADAGETARKFEGKTAMPGNAHYNEWDYTVARGKRGEDGYTQEEKHEPWDIHNNRLANIADSADMITQLASAFGKGDMSSGLGAVGSLLARGGGMAGAGSLLAGLGMAGGIATAAAGAVKAVNVVGGQVQDMRNMGSIQGGGAADGFYYESQIRMMALNPFINTEQSRQIINSALQNGYTGKEFDTVTDFMAENLKKMNLSVADSTELLEKNVREGGQSIQSLSRDLETIKGLAGDGTVLSTEQRAEQYKKLTGNMIDNDVSGEMASQQALNANAIFDDNPVLAGMFSEGLQNVNNAGIMRMAQMEGIKARTPNQARKLLGESGKMNESFWALIRSNAERFRKRYETAPEQAVEQFQQMMAAQGIELTANQASELLKQALDPNNANITEKADQEIEKEQFGVESNGRSGDIGDMIGKSIETPIQAIKDTFGMFWKSGDETWTSNFSEAYKRTADRYNEAKNAEFKGRSKTHVAALDALIDQHGVNNLDFFDEEGNSVWNSIINGNMDMEEFNKKISEGKYKVSVNGGEKMSLKDADKKAREEGVKADGGNKSVDVKISPTPELKRLLKFDSRTQNQEQSDSGYGRATRNNPPAGDR